jgi:hypothetical protein
LFRMTARNASFLPTVWMLECLLHLIQRSHSLLLIKSGSQLLSLL